MSRIHSTNSGSVDSIVSRRRRRLLSREKLNECKEVKFEEVEKDKRQEVCVEAMVPRVQRQ
jgi:hypothetical protein